MRVGRSLWEKKAARAKFNLSDAQLSRHAARFKYASLGQMFYEIASGLFDLNDLIYLVRTGKTPEEEAEEEESASTSDHYDRFREHAQTSGQEALVINGEFISGVAVEYASCCNPIPGDRVFGYTSKGGRLKIHRTVCRNAPPPVGQPCRTRTALRLESPEGCTVHRGGYVPWARTAWGLYMTLPRSYLATLRPIFGRSRWTQRMASLRAPLFWMSVTWRTLSGLLHV